jgi:energy-coupling factor transport system permease protein
VSFRRRTSPLHGARAAVGVIYCVSLALAALLVSAPLALCALIAAVLGAGAAAGVGCELRRAGRLALVLGASVMAINALVSREGVTVIWRLGELPVLGRIDVTLEATAYGAILGLRAVVLLLCGALYTAAIDPDEVLRMLRRVSFRSALTATLATRMVPILARDARRLADAQRCRPGPPPSRLAVMRAATAGLLERALDVAAALEVRGYALGRRPPRRRVPWSRQDLAFAAATAGVLGWAIAVRATGLEPFQAYPTLRAPLGPTQVVVAAAVAAAALTPFTARRGMER